MPKKLNQKPILFNETMLVTRTAKLFEAGDYPDKNVNYTVEDLDNMIEQFSEFPVKVQHTDTVFDGLLGNVKKIWRVGKELFGSISLAAPIWEVLDKAKRTKLSVGINADKLLYEVSFVNSPRVKTAQVFNDDGSTLYYATFEEYDDLDYYSKCKRVGKALNATLGDYDWGYVVDLRDDYVVCSINGDTYKYDYSFDASDNCEITNQRATHNVWVDEVSNEEEITEEITMAENTISQEQFDALMKQNAQLLKENRDSKISGMLKEFSDAGKIVPASAKFAKDILTATYGSNITFGDDKEVSIMDAFRQFLDAQPKVVEFTEVGKTVEPEVKTDASVEFSTIAEDLTGQDMLAQFAMTEEDFKKYRKVGK